MPLINRFVYLVASAICAALLATPAWAGAGGGCGSGGPSTLPEPASIVLLAAGVGGILVIRGLRKNKK